jgi:hypothetical protein
MLFFPAGEANPNKSLLPHHHFSKEHWLVRAASRSCCILGILSIGEGMMA